MYYQEVGTTRCLFVMSKQSAEQVSREVEVAGAESVARLVRTIVTRVVPLAVTKAQSFRLGGGYWLIISFRVDLLITGRRRLVLESCELLRCVILFLSRFNLKSVVQVVDVVPVVFPATAY